ncbi:MAG TPA: GNAT family N-acetyltransferase [Dehalococcoidia bacterium]|nr:GNAT family N-acetyltransferase [Dehalococcoidia bacterium]
MNRQNKLPSSQENSGALPEDSIVPIDHEIEVTVPVDPGPNVETRKLFRRLYGIPQDYDTASPFLATFTRYRSKLRPAALTSPRHVNGSIEYRYWPDLKLGYIDNVFIGSNMRRQGFGVRLVKFATDHLRRKGSRTVFAFTVNPPGLGLFISAGFTPESPEDASYPWRRWVSKEYC